MPEYIFPPDPGEDPDRLQQAAFDFLQARWPNWEPAEGNLEAWLVAACARMVAEAATVAADVPAAIFKYFGASIAGVPPIEERAAEVSSTWTVRTNPAGRTIAAGTLVGIPDNSGEVQPFEVVNSVTVATGSLTTAAGAVLLRSLDRGAYLSGLGGNGVVVQPIDSQTWYNTVTLTSVTTGGRDAERDDAYLDRLSARLTLMAPRPILPRDFALLAIDIASQNGVNARAVALDGYNPANNTSNNERMVAVAMIDAVTGGDLSQGVKDAVDAGLQAQREASFIVNIMNPTRTTVDVTFQARVLPGRVVTEVRDSAIAAVRDYLQPFNWGKPAGSAAKEWNNQTVVRYLELATVLNNVEGLDYVTSLTIGLNGGAQTAADQNLTGAAPVTTPGAITGAVS